MTRRLLLTAVLVGLLWTAAMGTLYGTAFAAVPKAGDPGDGQLYAQIRAALVYWQNDSQFQAYDALAPGPVQMTGSFGQFEDDGVLGQALVGSGHVTIDIDLASSSRRGVWDRRYWLKVEFDTVVHEVAHAFNWRPGAGDFDPADPYHSIGGMPVMDAEFDGSFFTYEAKRFAADTLARYGPKSQKAKKGQRSRSNANRAPH